ncbi:YqcC family protein [Neiella sp. HB171785]|uniref:YqcC family protein n=1 Tax=Neiella litorisoli TaxID=2771431 RepID=A0A8J6UM17_9GAMM|nr:YqcC family protein [Neiella litorisoli]MBD1389715.1 YqcC family protein [Neiella litorisoli]
MVRRQTMAKLLEQLETELKAQQLWQSQPPSAQALASTEPFCIDTLSLAQWLQFVFLPTMRQLLAEQRQLPESIAIAPLADEVYRHQMPQRAALIDIIRKIDAC